MRVNLLHRMTLGIFVACGGPTAHAADRLEVMVRFEEPSQEPETVRLAPIGSERLDVSMGYTVARLDFSRPVCSARMRSHTTLPWREGAMTKADLTGIERALSTAWQPMPCRESSCEPRTLRPRAPIHEPTVQGQARGRPGEPAHDRHGCGIDA